MIIDPDIRESKGRLELRIDEPFAVLKVDEIQIQQVLVNLIRNAIDAMKDTPVDRREITMTAQVIQDGHGEVTVRDAGSGLAADELEQVFDAFFTTKQEGMGMGLPISRSIVEAHGGKLWAQSNKGPGVTFGFTIRQLDVCET